MSLRKKTKVRTVHTVLGRITSKGSGGRCEIIRGYTGTYIDFSDPHLTSAKFTTDDFNVGDYVAVKITLTGGGRRLIGWVRNLTTEYGPAYSDQEKATESFLVKFDYDLKLQAHALTRAFGHDAEHVVEKPMTAEEKSLSESFFIDKKVSNLFDTTIKIVEQTNHASILMVGPSGYGKSSIPENIAQRKNMGFYRQDCATVRDPEEFFGYRGAQDGSTLDENGKPIFIKTEFTKKVEAGNTIIVLDEINRTDPFISNALFPMLDHAGKTTILGHDVVVGPGTIFVGTMNVGYQFTGTFSLDGALQNRFMASVKVGPLTATREVNILVKNVELEEDKAKRLVRVINNLRSVCRDKEIDVDVSTRTSIQIAHMLKNGMNFEDAFFFRVVTLIEDEYTKLFIDTIQRTD